LLPVCCPSSPPVCLTRQHNLPSCRHFSRTGATGLEPATSGVTGRHGATGYYRLRPGITCYSRHFLIERAGYDRLRPATVGHSPCSRRVVDVMPASTTARVRTPGQRLQSEIDEWPAVTRAIHLSYAELSDVANGVGARVGRAFVGDPDVGIPAMARESLADVLHPGSAGLPARDELEADRMDGMGAGAVGVHHLYGARRPVQRGDLGSVG
jgi:hypothetical protein